MPRVRPGTTSDRTCVSALGVIMKLLANENMPGLVVRSLREDGHDVLWARESMAGSSDDAILSAANEQSRLLLTFDRDFGELVFRRGRQASCGIVLFRIGMHSPEVVANAVRTVLGSRSDWHGFFSVVEDDRIRMIPLPRD